MFLQIAEVRVADMDRVLPKIIEAETAWRSATVGRRMAVRERLYADRDAPGRYLAVNEFPSYDLAMENSNLPETGTLAEAVGALVDDVPGYWNLDLLLDMRSEELDRLAEAVVGAFATGALDPVLFADDVLFDINVPQWRFQVKGRVEAQRVIQEDAPAGNDVESWQMTKADDALVIEMVTRSRADRGLSRQLCLAGLERGRVASVVVYCTGIWDSDHEAAHAEAPMLNSDFVWRAR